jgi:hypothetical protein
MGASADLARALGKLTRAVPAPEYDARVRPELLADTFEELQAETMADVERLEKRVAEVEGELADALRARASVASEYERSLPLEYAIQANKLADARSTIAALKANVAELRELVIPTS